MSLFDAPITPLKRRVDALEANAFTTDDLTPAFQGKQPNSAGSSSVSLGFSYFSLEPVSKDGLITKFSVYVGSVAGTPAVRLLLIRATATAGTYQLVRSITLTVSGVGLNEWTAATIGDLPVLTGDYIGVYADSANYGRPTYTASGGPGFLGRGGGAMTDGQTFTITQTVSGALLAAAWVVTPAAALSLGLSDISYGMLDAPLKGKVDAGTTAGTVSTDNQSRLNFATRSYTRTYSQDFSGSAPTGWTRSTGWTDSASGMMSPTGAGDVSQYAYSDKSLYAEFQFKKVIFIPQAAGVEFFAGSRLGSTGTARATLFSISGASNLLRIHASGSTWATEPAVVSSTAIAGLVAGRRYALEMKRNIRIQTVTLKDLVTGATWSVSAGTNSSTDYSDGGVGEQFGAPVLINKTGQTLFESFRCWAAPLKPRALIIGDSITHGRITTLAQRWGQIVIDALKGQGSICALDGAQTDIIPLITATESTGLKPDWIIVNLGTNGADGSLSTFQTNIGNLKTYCDSNNINLALCILPPVPDRSTVALNSYMLGLKGVHFIRMDLALTQNNDGVTFVAANYAGDQLHPNATGQALMGARALIDLPELTLTA